MPGKTETAGGRSFDAIVIGAGIGGLTCAGLLAKAGLNVLVLEQHSIPGGYCTSWTRQVRRGERVETFTFDAGVHDVSGLGHGGAVRRVLERLGVARELELLPVTQEYVLDGRRLRLPHGKREVARVLGDAFPDDRAGIEAFLDEVNAIYGEIAGGEDLASDERIQALRRARRWFGASYLSMVKTFVRSPKTRELLLMPSGYLGHDPVQIPAVTMCAVIGGYWLVGGVTPAGGSQRLADLLVSTVEHAGGVVRLRADVRRVRVQRGRVVGVALASGEHIDAPTVISNACVGQTLRALLEPNELPAGSRHLAENARPSTSAFTVYLGLDAIPDVSAMCMLRGERSMSIANPSAVDPGLAPPGHASVSLTVLIPPDDALGWDRSAPNYAQRKTQLGDELIDAAETLLPDLRHRIVYREEASPATFARYTRSTGGAVYGMVAPELVGSSTDLPGLFLCGAGTAPGPGIEGVVRSGARTADLLRPQPRW